MTEFQDVTYSPVQGEIAQPIDPNQATEEDDQLSTLDEPVKVTILRDLKAVGQKFAHIIYPRNNSILLKDWDLWGPLLLCVIMAALLQGVTDDKTGEMGPQFAEVFVVVWAGAALVTLNAQLLGSHISFFQSVCVLGYCIVPLVVAMIICWVLVHVFNESVILVVIRLLVTAAAYGWSIHASIAFLGNSQPEGRKALAVYPICLFYFILAWMVATYA